MINLRIFEINSGSLHQEALLGSESPRHLQQLEVVMVIKPKDSSMFMWTKKDFLSPSSAGINCKIIIIIITTTTTERMG